MTFFLIICDSKYRTVQMSMSRSAIACFGGRIPIAYAEIMLLMADW